MNARALLMGLIAAGTVQAVAAQPTDGPPLNEREAVAVRFVERLQRREYDQAFEAFDSVMKKAIPPAELQKTWESILAAAGAFQEVKRVRTEKVPKFTVVLVTCQFENATLDAKVVFGEGNEITGLWFAPTASAAKYEPPTYVQPDKFDEHEVQVGSGLWVLPGTISMPRGDGPFPAVVLVHGSGPNDRDETIGPNKPFRDLAGGLASQGIAVLRYEKRTRQHPLKLLLIRHTLTVKEETIDDALAAVALMRQTDGIDPQRVFLLGHSLGGMLLPRIGRRDPQLAGLIVFAGSTRPLEEIILDQLAYIFSLNGQVSEVEQEKLEKVKQQVARVQDPQLSASITSADLPLGIPATYWLDLRGYDPPTAAKDLKLPMLVLQGERDYQVTMDDFRGWQAALSARDDVVLQSYPRYNHLFIAGEGKSTPAEYQQAGHVAEEVVRDIAGWMGRR